jgi:diguanylate cyclase (GGDEF)-like protein
MQLMSGKSSSPLSQESPVILIADDDKSFRQLLRRILEREGYTVFEVCDGQQCVEVYETVKPDIVLLDAMMPVMDGFTCCKQLLQVARNNLLSALTSFNADLALGSTVIARLWERTPILMITNLDDEDSVNRAFDVGATDYVTKPIQLTVLRLRLRQLLQQAQVYKQLEAANQALQQLVTIDSLTSLANRRRFDDYLHTQWINLVQEEAPLSLILCDIDFFKLYNDKYGHPEGDLCLQKVGHALNQHANKNQNLVARYGGEEFAVIMPHTDIAGAVDIAQTIQAGVRDLQITHHGSTINHYVTLSLGVATMIPTWDLSPSDLIVKADKALYQAKAAGRDRIVSSTAQPQ